MTENTVCTGFHEEDFCPACLPTDCVGMTDCDDFQTSQLVGGLAVNFGTCPNCRWTVPLRNPPYCSESCSLHNHGLCGKQCMVCTGKALEDVD